MMVRFALISFALSLQLTTSGALPDTCPDPSFEASLEADCSFYQDCVESSVACGADGYALGYGGKYCGKFVENLAEFSDEGSDWILGTLTCLKDALVPIVELPGGTTCDSLASTAFDSHVFCYMDNGFCELIFNFLDPLALGGFVQDLLNVFELEDFAQYVAIKQVYDVMTQCPTYGGKTTDAAVGIVDAIVTCPESFNASESVLSTYRNAPFNDINGAEIYLGYKQSYEEPCSSCGYTIVDGKYLYGYNYAWNAETGERSFWEAAEKGFGETPSWWENCPAPYSRANWWGRFRGEPCSLPSDFKFLGEECSDTKECANKAVSGYVDVVCGGRGVCVFAEDDEREFGAGVTQMSIFDFGDQCSNCRVSNEACSAYGSANPFDIDTSAVVAGSGVLAFAGVGLVGFFAMNRRIKRNQGGQQAKILQMSGGVV
mmetsp:Transcript_22946/g.45763  ORF Transcript_22946/g.45763 Transcript_22946/m.45763 type:complete len:431 (-) Transcript_22946:39-1331(-)